MPDTMERWAIKQAELLDAIERVADDPEKVRELTATRFQIAADCGIETVFKGLEYIQ